MGGDDLDFTIKFIKLIEKHSALYDHNSEGNSNRIIQEQAWRTIANELGENWITCKDKWKNIRSCYTRHLRLKQKVKKPYYLAEHLEFLFPFCKSATSHKSKTPPPSSSNTILWSKVDNIEVVEQEQGDLTVFENTVDEFNGKHLYFTVHNTEDKPKNDADNEIITIAQNKPETVIQPKASGFNRWRNRKRRLIFPGEKRTVEPIQKKLHNDNSIDNPDLNFLKSLLPDMQRMDNKQKNKLKMKILQEIYNILYAEDMETVAQAF